MNAPLILIVGFVILAIAYVTYGKWLSKVWGVDESRVTPAHELEDGMDYVPAKVPVLMGHHFSSIAGAGPINGPIQAAVFGWVPVVLWVLIGGIFFGAVHDYGALFASIRHKGQSIGEVISANIGTRAKRLFIIFSYLTLILVVAAFASIVAGTFNGVVMKDGVLNQAASDANSAVAMISLLFIALAVMFGYAVYRKGMSLKIATILGVIGLVACLVIGLMWHPIYLDQKAWMMIIAVYIMIASVSPVWILLQPRDYLSSFLLYGMMIIAFVGIVGAGVMGTNLNMEIPAFTGMVDTISTNSLGSIFPAIFITIACGAISGFHSLVGSGTTSKQLDREQDARPIAYGGMLIECGLALISLCAVGYVWAEYVDGSIRVPTAVFATGLSRMVATIPGLEGTMPIISALLILAVSTFCLTSLDTATRLARYMFQEFWLQPGQTYKDATGFKAVLCNPYVATLITVVLGVSLGMGGYATIWPLFGASNQLLAALSLLAVASWLGNIGKNNKMFIFPMIFMLIVTLTSLGQTAIAKFTAIQSVGASSALVIQLVLAVVLLVLAGILAVEGCGTMMKQYKNAKK